jgi:hypothetical protein
MLFAYVGPWPIEPDIELDTTPRVQCCEQSQETSPDPSFKVADEYGLVAERKAYRFRIAAVLERI